MSFFYFCRVYRTVLKNQVKKVSKKKVRLLSSHIGDQTNWLWTIMETKQIMHIQELDN